MDASAGHIREELSLEAHIAKLNEMIDILAGTSWFRGSGRNGVQIASLSEARQQTERNPKSKDPPPTLEPSLTSPRSSWLLATRLLGVGCVTILWLGGVY